MKRHYIFLLLFACHCTVTAEAKQDAPRSSSFFDKTFNAIALVDIVAEYASNKHEPQTRIDDICNGGRLAVALTQWFSEESNTPALVVYCALLTGHALYRYATNRGSIRKINVKDLIEKIKTTKKDASSPITPTIIPATNNAPECMQTEEETEVESETKDEGDQTT